MHNTLNLSRKVGSIFMVNVAEQREQANKILKNIIGLDVDSEPCAEVLTMFLEFERPEIAKVLLF